VVEFISGDTFVIGGRNILFTAHAYTLNK